MATWLFIRCCVFFRRRRTLARGVATDERGLGMGVGYRCNEYWIDCDVPGCESDFEVAADCVGLKETMERALSSGWMYVGGKGWGWLCPRHRKEWEKEKEGK